MRASQADVFAITKQRKPDHAPCTQLIGAKVVRAAKADQVELILSQGMAVFVQEDGESMSILPSEALPGLAFHTVG